MRFAILPLSAALCVAMLSPTAPAQISGSMSNSFYGGDTFRPQVKRSEIDVLSRILKLSAEERGPVVALFEAHDAEVRNEGRVVREKCRELMEEAELLQRQTLQTRVPKEVEAWVKRKDELEKQFLSDLTAMLTKEQEERWPIVERELRRPKMLANSWMSGEGIDVIALVASIDGKAAEEPKVVEILERYANEVDAALKTREAFVKEHSDEIAELMKTDPQRVLSLRKDSVRNRVRVREINRRYVQQVAAELKEPSKKKFLDEYVNRSIEWWNRETPAERFIEAAAKSDGFSSKETRNQAQTLLKEYKDKVEALTRKTLEEYQNWEEARVPEMLALALGTMTEEKAKGNTFSEAPDDSPLGKVRLERLKLDREYRSKVRALLSEEQMAGIDTTIEDSTRYFSLDDSPRL
jgi:hypothetical protein